MPIRRHLKVRSEANPYDPRWEVYFEERLDAYLLNNPGAGLAVGL